VPEGHYFPRDVWKNQARGGRVKTQGGNRDTNDINWPAEKGNLGGTLKKIKCQRKLLNGSRPNFGHFEDAGGEGVYHSEKWYQPAGPQPKRDDRDTKRVHKSSVTELPEYLFGALTLAVVERLLLSET